MAEVVEVECPNRRCAGRTEAHARDCRCEGTGEVVEQASADEAQLLIADALGGPPPPLGPSLVPCPDEPLDADPERWSATWHPATHHRPGEWEADIHCPACSEEGVAVDG